MYETIMDLPLFKGVSKDQVSNFLAKTHLQFLNYKSGETILTPDESCVSLRYILTGDARITHSSPDGTLTIAETATTGTVLGADRLFGLNREYGIRVTALSPVSVMEFSKEQYMNLLNSDRIYMFNLLNYLSLRAQRPADLLLSSGDGSLAFSIALWLSILTLPTSSDITVTASAATLSAHTNIPMARLRRECDQLESEGLIRRNGDVITVCDRWALLQFSGLN